MTETVAIEDAPHPVIQPNKLGWMAGVVDLRGKIIRKKNKKRATPQIVLMVESSEITVIRELSSLTGTRPEIQGRQHIPEWMRRGCQEHCPEAHFHVTEHSLPDIARWTQTGASAAVVLYNLLPFLMSDRQWLAIMLECMGQATLTGQGSGATGAAVRRLAGLGWEVPPQFEILLAPSEIIQAEVISIGEGS